MITIIGWNMECIFIVESSGEAILKNYPPSHTLFTMAVLRGTLD